LRSEPSPPRRDDWLTQLGNFWSLARSRLEAPAPVEERALQSSPPQAATARAPARSVPDPIALAQANPRKSEPPLAPPPLAPIDVPRAQAGSLPNPAPPAEAPALIAQPRLQTSPSGTLAPPAQILEPPARPWNGSQEELALQARRMLADTVPRVAAQAQTDASRVLWIASTASHPSERQAVVDAAYATWPSERTSIPASKVAPSYARQLHDDARLAFTARNRDASSALDIELRAFGANPGDPDIAGYLAFLHLRMNPVQPETARQLALYAIAISGSRRPARPDDWNTLAIASALTGRETDATAAFLVEVALTNNLDRSCRAALNAYASFGERLRTPVEAMFYRIRTQGRGSESPNCARPSYWSAVTRWQ
jgi:hypothetical protein